MVLYQCVLIVFSLHRESLKLILAMNLPVVVLSQYAPDNINIDKKKQDMFLNGLNDDIQFQLLNMDYADFQHMVDKAIVIKNKITKMEKGDKRKMSFHGQPSRSTVRPRFSQPNQFFKPPQIN
jgi:hypothetical protein